MLLVGCGARSSDPTLKLFRRFVEMMAWTSFRSNASLNTVSFGATARNWLPPQPILGTCAAAHHQAAR
jgi:hypothetical protein